MMSDVNDVKELAGDIEENETENRRGESFICIFSPNTIACQVLIDKSELHATIYFSLDLCFPFI